MVEHSTGKDRKRIILFLRSTLFCSNFKQGSKRLAHNLFLVHNIISVLSLPDRQSAISITHSAIQQFTIKCPQMADEIAKAAIDKFESLPLRLRQLDTQFTVLCGIIARNKVSSCLQVLSLCTGTKCCSHMETNRHGRGRVLSDSHAEVLARRGLERFLLLTMLSGSNPVGATATTDDVMMACTDGKWQLRDEWELHMYISDPPCGDCAIYQRLGQSSSTSRSSGSDASSGLSHTTGFTGAKLLSKPFTAPGMDAPPVAQAPATSRETGSQVLGAVRLKPMRSDLPDYKRSRSMSCSDKLCRWMRLGMQGI